MKFTYIAGLLGATSAVDVDKFHADDTLIQEEAENLETEC
jgi:hypothetical protein